MEAGIQQRPGLVLSPRCPVAQPRGPLGGVMGRAGLPGKLAGTARSARRCQKLFQALLPPWLPGAAAGRTLRLGQHRGAGGEPPCGPDPSAWPSWWVPQLYFPTRHTQTPPLLVSLLPCAPDSLTLFNPSHPFSLSKFLDQTLVIPPRCLSPAHGFVPGCHPGF